MKESTLVDPAIVNFLEGSGFTLESEQPHISGERFLMMKEKLVLVGKKNNTQERVVIKISNKAGGKEEILKEKEARDVLKEASFADQNILFPKELYFENNEKYCVWIIEFIEQERVFVTYPLQEQFFMILNAFEAQESFHATTFEHLESVKKIFSIYYAQEYFKEFEKFQKSFSEKYNDKKIFCTLEKSAKFLSEHKRLIDRYCNYLTHTDFVPHNFRIREKKVYMLDCSAVQFGNKYEGWARFLNYMTLHNPPLEELLKKYVRENRGDDEYLSLRIMRIYKLGLLLEYYARSLEKTSGDLRILTEKRISFWHEVLLAILEDRVISKETLDTYLESRDNLRSEDEKKRQREFAVAN